MAISLLFIKFSFFILDGGMWPWYQKHFTEILWQNLTISISVENLLRIFGTMFGISTSQ